MLVDPRSSAGISNAILRLLSDGKLWHRISKGAIANAANFSWDETAKAEAGLFKELESRRSEGKIAIHLGK